MSAAARCGLVALLALGIAVTVADDAPASPRHLIVVSIDTLRADRLGCYGHDRPTSPHIDRLAAAGVTFDDASAPSPWTKPSHASLFTGVYPARHGASSMAGTLSPTVPTLAERLAADGYETLAVVNSTLLHTDGLERGFERVVPVPVVQGDRHSAPVTPQAIAALRQRDPSRPLFAFVHYMDVHSDYLSLPRFESRFVGDYRGFADGSTQQLYRQALGLFDLLDDDVRHLRDLYDAGIRQLDDQLGTLIAALEADGLLEDALLVILSDHGEEFLEHGSVLHGHSQFQEVLRVPLILHGPGLPAGTRIATPASLIDVVPTALSQLGKPAAADLDGIDLTPTWSGDADQIVAERTLIYEADLVFPPPGPGKVPEGPYRAVRWGRFKLVLDVQRSHAALFDLETDPGERNNVIAQHPQLAQKLFDAYRRHLARAQR